METRNKYIYHKMKLVHISMNTCVVTCITTQRLRSIQFKATVVMHSRCKGCD